MRDLEQYAEHFRQRTLQDLLAEVTPQHWLRRAEALETVGTERCTAMALACRNRALVEFAEWHHDGDVIAALRGGLERDVLDLPDPDVALDVLVRRDADRGRRMSTYEIDQALAEAELARRSPQLALRPPDMRRRHRHPPRALAVGRPGRARHPGAARRPRGHRQVDAGLPARRPTSPEGGLPGTYFGQPRAVIVAATEDSWAHTIVPRLMAAGADLERVYRVDVHDLRRIRDRAQPPARPARPSRMRSREVDAGLILLDPLMSRLDGKLDTHKDAEVRQALEPLVQLADRTERRDPRSDPPEQVAEHRPAHDADGLAGIRRRRSGRPVLHGRPRRRDGARARSAEEQPRSHRPADARLPHRDRARRRHRRGARRTGQVDWTGESTAQPQRGARGRLGRRRDHRTATQEAADWLVDWLTDQGGTDESATIKREGAKAGHSQDCLKRARRRLGAEITSEGFPRRTYWTLPGHAVGATPGESAPTALTTPTALTEAQLVQSERSVQSEGSPERCPE